MRCCLLGGLVKRDWNEGLKDVGRGEEMKTGKEKMG